MKRLGKKLWRMLLRRCLLCGRRRHLKKDYPYAGSYPNKRYCHWCNKSLMYYEIYSGSAKMMLEQLRRV